jgi:hypothetical protein
VNVQIVSVRVTVSSHPEDKQVRAGSAVSGPLPSVSINCADRGAAVDAQFLGLTGIIAFQIEMNALHYEIFQAHHSPPKAACRADFQGKYLTTFHLERFRNDRRSQDAFTKSSCGL